MSDDFWKRSRHREKKICYLSLLYILPSSGCFSAHSLGCSSRRLGAGALPVPCTTCALVAFSPLNVTVLLRHFGAIWRAGLVSQKTFCSACRLMWGSASLSPGCESQRLGAGRWEPYLRETFLHDAMMGRTWFFIHLPFSYCILPFLTQLSCAQGPCLAHLSSMDLWRMKKSGREGGFW